MCFEEFKFVFEGLKTFLGKGENAGYPECFQKPPSLGLIKLGIVW